MSWPAEVPIANDTEPGPDADVVHHLSRWGGRRTVGRAPDVSVDRRGEKLNDLGHVLHCTSRSRLAGMSRGHRRIERVILEAVGSSSRHGSTIDALVWRCYPGEEPTEAHRVAVQRALRRLIAQGRLIEQSGFYGRHISPAVAPKPRLAHAGAEAGWLRCARCDVAWLREHAATCWSCGSPGVSDRDTWTDE
jgi:hypothetical protein